MSLHEALEFVLTYWPAMTLGVIVLGAATYLSWTTIPGEGTMKMTKGDYVLSKRQQKLREHTKIADGIASMLLDLFNKNELTAERYQYWHLRFGTQLALKDLLPVKLTPVQIKEAMKKRIGNGVYKPVNIPGGKTEARAKNVIDKILRKHLPA